MVDSCNIFTLTVAVLSSNFDKGLVHVLVTIDCSSDPDSLDSEFDSSLMDKDRSESLLPITDYLLSGAEKS